MGVNTWVPCLSRIALATQVQYLTNPVSEMAIVTLENVVDYACFEVKKMAAYRCKMRSSLVTRV